jgi:hypothetical protein
MIHRKNIIATALFLCSLLFIAIAHPTPDNERRGEIFVHGTHERRQGSSVQIQDTKDLYVSKDGHTRHPFGKKIQKKFIIYSLKPE